MATVIHQKHVHLYFLAALVLVALFIALSFVRTHKPPTYPGEAPAPAAGQYGR